VLLVVLLASLPTRFPLAGDSAFPASLQALYIRPRSPFVEVDAFVAASATAYHLDLSTSDLPMKAALGRYLDAEPRVRAVFVGTRRTDPHGSELASFQPTDRDWPSFMRVHPVVDWHYREVWAVSASRRRRRCLEEKLNTSLC
jgi:FAD synthetase